MNNVRIIATTLGLLPLWVQAEDNLPPLQKQGYHEIVKKIASSVVHLRTNHASGSGVIISKDGYIITNSHVIDGVTSLMIETRSRDQFPAKIVGIDPGSDIAVIKTSSKHLSVAQLGDSSKLEQGEIVIALGNPQFNLHSVAVGIVSALGRTDRRAREDIQNYIQTDAAINAGNSGGGLFDSTGKLIGINSWGFKKHIAEGLNYAIPINQAMNIAEQLIENGAVQRGKLGIEVYEMEPNDRQTNGFPRHAVGVLVSTILEGGPADRAGLKIGDLITELDRETIEYSGVLQAVAGSNPPSRKVKIVYYRKSQKKESWITLSN
ncbi:MAG: trypsin-like peptidase domain-containing protein [Verrucomicrobiales bacterium]|nr:trypsin-like peptidase domain-containing protein [Verrucomicrobiales bacterium]